MPLDAARNLFPRMYPRMVEILQLLGSSSLMALPTEADFDTELEPDLERYLATGTATGLERVRLFRLAWGRGVQRVRLPAGALRAILLRRPLAHGRRPSTASTTKQPLKDRVRDFLARG